MLSYLKWKLISFMKVVAFNIKYAIEVDAIDDYDLEITDLGNAIANIQKAEGIKTTDTTGMAVDANVAKREMAETLVQFARKGLPKARKAKNNLLIGQLRKRISYFFKAANVDALARAKDLRKIIIENAAILTNIKPADILEIDAVIAAFEAVYMLPSEAIDTKKIEGTETLIEEFQKGEDAIENMYDYFYGEYYKTKKTLVKELAECRNIEIEGVHHTGLIAVCMDANLPQGAITHLLEGVKMKIVELNREALSDINGLCGIVKFKSGTYHVEFSKDGFVTKQMIIIFKRGRMEEVEVELVREVNP